MNSDPFYKLFLPVSSFQLPERLGQRARVLDIEHAGARVPLDHFVPERDEAIRFLREVPAAIFSGAVYTPPDALVRGLVQEIAEPEALIDRALTAARGLAALPPAAFALTKRQIREPSLLRMQSEKVEAAIEAIWTAPETLDRIRDYVARTLRKP